MDRGGGRSAALVVGAVASLLLSAALAGTAATQVGAGDPTNAPPPDTRTTSAPATTAASLRTPLARVDAASRQAVVPAPPIAWMRSPEGFLVAAGEGEPLGPGPATRFTVEVEVTFDDRLEELVHVVEEALFDPRSWTAGGRHVVQRVDDPARAHIRIVLASPSTVDRACARIGLDTRGHLSCWDGRRAMLNVWRFDHGAPHFESLDDYRRYVVNHEVGHGLGYDHVGCPTAGQPAPVMMQQTKSVEACLPNPWPRP